MSDAVQQIKDRLNIIDVVGAYVDLHKAGRHFKGKSPFSNERTPSFYVNPERGMYYCFSTNQGGDIFTFIQTIEGMEFRDALQLLAEKANVELTPHTPADRSVRDRQYQALAAAADFYARQLAATPAAVEYLSKRGVSEYTRERWQIGYAPGPPHGGWRELRTHLQEQGYTDTELLAVGLIKQVDAGKEPFDVFRDRIVFPMSDAQGRVVAFSGRILHPNEKAPKYLNTPETDLYHKSSLLYGYDKAKHSLRKLPFWLIVEGQFDVVMAHQAGYTNAVAVSGTALTVTHVQQLERLCERVVLALDADRAGVSAMQKAATVMLSRGLDLKVAALPEGKDPADMVQVDKGELKACIGHATHIIDFMLQYLQKDARDERTFKLQVRTELLPYITLIPNEIDQDHFITQVATQTGTSVDAIRHEVQRLREQAAAPVLTQEVRSPAITTPEAAVVSMDRRQALAAYLRAIESVIEREWQKRVEQMLRLRLGEGAIELVHNDADAALMERFHFQIEETFSTLSPRQQAEEVVDRVNQYIEIVVHQSLRECRSQLSAAEAMADQAALETAMRELQTWQQVRTFDRFQGEHILEEVPLD